MVKLLAVVFTEMTTCDPTVKKSALDTEDPRQATATGHLDSEQAQLRQPGEAVASSEAKLDDRKQKSPNRSYSGSGFFAQHLTGSTGSRR
ncbi:hypothetical protein [Hydrogenophaga sp.]|uniref:hypothetical protein n=1 Tax=Hydrogenophaga sp. TaxID=1904254 RepID=UPI003AF9E7D2